LPVQAPAPRFAIGRHTARVGHAGAYGLESMAAGNGPGLLVEIIVDRP
jgi:hypothetical protein